MKKTYFFIGMLLCGTGAFAQISYTSTSDVSAWNAARWNNATDAPPYTSAYTANNNVSFTAGAYNLAGMGATINVGNVNVANGVTVNFTVAANTFATGGNVRTIDIGSGGLFDFNSQSISAAAGVGFIKNGTGVFATGAGTFTGGFTLNAGTIIVRSVNGMGAGGALTINGGIIAANASRDLTAKYAGGITVGGDFTLGATTGLASSAANLIFTNDMALGTGTTRIITIGGTGTYTLGGIIGGTGSNLTVTNTAAGILSLTGANAYSGLTTISGGTLQLNKAGGGTLPSTNNVTVNGGTLRISSNQTLNNLTIATGATLTVDAGVTLTINGTLSTGASITNANNLIINGTLQINAGGALSGTPTYGGSSTLIYNTTSYNTTTNEFPASGVNNVTITAPGGTNTVTLDADKTITGTLAVGAHILNGGKSMNAATITIGAGSMVMGDLTTSAAFTCSGASSISLTGSWSVTGFTKSTSMVTFAGTGNFNNATSFYNLTNSAGTRSIIANIDVESTLLVSGGDMRISGGSARSLTMSGAASVINITSGSITGTDAGAGNDLFLVISGAQTTLTGNATINDDHEKKFYQINVQSAKKLILARGILCRYGTFTVEGTIQINTNGYVQNVPVASKNPAYNSSAGALIYNNGGSYTSAAEWPAANGPFNVTVQNNSEVTLTGNRTINGTLAFIIGKIITNANKVIISSTGSVTGGGSGWVIGNLQKNLPVSGGAISRIFEIGGTGTPATAYRPVTVAFASVSTAGGLTASVSQTAGTYAPLTGSGLHATNNLQRYFTLTNSGIVFSTYDATFSFVAGDVVGTATNYVVRKYNGSAWSAPVTSIANPTNTKGTGFTSFSDFVMGEPLSLVVDTDPVDATVCAGDNASFTATSSSTPTPTVQWQRDAGAGFVDVDGTTDGGVYSNFTTTTLNITGVTAALNGYYYRAVFTNINGTAASGIALLSTSNTWLTTGTTDWETDANWSCGLKPTAGDNVIIPAGGTQPVLTAPTTIRNIALDGNITLNGQTLTVDGAISGPGTLSGSPTSNLVINAALSQLNFDQTGTNNSLNNLTLNDPGPTAAAALYSALDIYGAIVFTGVTSLDLQSNHLTLKSTAAGTARISTIPFFSSLFGTDNVTVERYIDNPQRSWHLLSAQAVTGSQNIYDAWQEGGTIPGSAPANQGTLITSNLYSGANGFDMASVSSSILTHNQGAGGSPSWNYNLPATNSNALSDYQGYMLFVRGDRNCLPSPVTVTPTVLRATGTLTQGDITTVTVSSNGTGNTLVGNPYASPIDMEKILAPGGVPTPNLDQNFMVWDPALAGNFTLGGFRAVVRTGVNVYNQTPVVLGGPTTTEPTIQYIHSGSAFFLHATGTDVTVPFTEECKAVLPTTVYNPIVTTPGDQQILANLMLVQPGNTTSLADGIRVMYNSTFSAGTADDIIKMGNFNENISSFRANKKLIVERRPMIGSGDTIFLRMTNLGIKNYRFQVGTIDFVQLNVLAYLEDTYLNTITGLDLTGTVNNIDFSVTADPASANQDRFRIIFAGSGPLPVTFTSVKAAQTGLGNNIAVEWKVSNQLNIKQYEVEKSTDGINYVKVDTEVATGINGGDATYNWLDVNPVQGNNFYRIRSVGITGDVKISQVVIVKIGKGARDITVYPNPVINHTMGLQFTGMEKGIYQLRLVNMLGQAVFAKSVNHNGGSATETLLLGSGIATGNYRLEIFKPDNSKITRSLMITE